VHPLQSNAAGRLHLVPAAHFACFWNPVSLTHHHVEYHHQDKADGETDGADIGMLAA
jgi:hypothetical protein